MLTTADYLFAVTVYVAFRSTEPDVDTVRQVVVHLLENNIDITKLVIWPANHC